MEKRLLFLSKQYDLVVGDCFELFYRGIIRSINPYQYFIRVESKKGIPYPRYYTFTPKEEDVGELSLSVRLYNDQHELLDEATSILHVVKATPPKTKQNILCVGDSLTFNGVWCYEGFRRFCEVGGEPSGLGFQNSLELIGTCKKNSIGYEGYGGWQWRHFVNQEAVATTSSVWINSSSHHMDENDQHSVWESSGNQWILESIEEKRLKFKRGKNNSSCLPTIGNEFHFVEGGIHQTPIKVEGYSFEQGNPFFDETEKHIDFQKYCKKHDYKSIDYCYILLTWNGQYTPYNEDFSHFEPYILAFLRQMHKDYPSAKVRLIGIQGPSINGGLAANHGASGFYSDLFGEIWTAYEYDLYLEKFCEREEFSSWCKYIDMKGQFDVENNMPSGLRKVNLRSQVMERVGTNDVHPSMDGYLQIGDVFYRALVSDMNEEK